MKNPLPEAMLAAIEQAYIPVRDMWAERLRPGEPTNQDRLNMLVWPCLDAMLGEIRANRALLATPLPNYRIANIDEPVVVEERGHGSYDVVMHDGNRYYADEAIAIGAALMRAGLKAKESE